MEERVRRGPWGRRGTRWNRCGCGRHCAGNCLFGLRRWFSYDGLRGNWSRCCLGRAPVGRVRRRRQRFPCSRRCCCRCGTDRQRLCLPLVDRRNPIRILDAVAARQGLVVVLPVVVADTAGFETDGLRVFDGVENVPLTPRHCILGSSVRRGILRLSGAIVRLAVVHVATHRIVGIDIVRGVGFGR